MIKSALLIMLLSASAFAQQNENYAQTVRKLSDVQLAGHVAENTTFVLWNCGPNYLRQLKDENAKPNRSESIKCNYYSDRFRIAKAEVSRRAHNELVRRDLARPKVTDYAFSAALPVNNQGPVTEQGAPACLALIRPMFASWKSKQAWPAVPDLGSQSFTATRIDCQIERRDEEVVASGACRPFVMGNFLNMNTNTFDLVSKVDHIHSKAESERMEKLRKEFVAIKTPNYTEQSTFINEMSKIQIESGYHVFYDLVFQPGSTAGVLELRAVHGSTYWREQFQGATRREIIHMTPSCKIKMPIAVKSTPVRQGRIY